MSAITEFTQQDRLTQAMQSCTGKLAVGLVQLRDADGIANHHGHAARSYIAELLLRQLSSLLRPEDHVIPFGEDRAWLILDNLLDANHLQLAGLKLNRIFAEPKDMDGTPTQLSVATGFVYVGRHTLNFAEVEECLAKAESACIEAYGNDQNFVIKNIDDDESQSNHWQINQMLSVAMEQHQISLDYQPKVHLADGCIAGAEALVRWRSEGTVIPPDEFLPALSEQAMWDLTIYIYRRALRDILDYEIEIPVAINVDPSSLKQSEMLDFFRRETALWGIQSSSRLPRPVLSWT